MHGCGFLVHSVEWQQQADFTGGLYSRTQLENCKWRGGGGGGGKRQENCQPPGSKKLANGIRVNRPGTITRRKEFERPYLWPQYQ